MITDIRTDRASTFCCVLANNETCSRSSLYIVFQLVKLETRGYKVKLARAVLTTSELALEIETTKTARGSRNFEKTLIIIRCQAWKMYFEVFWSVKTSA